MKKIFILLILLFSISLCSCSGHVSENKEFDTEYINNNKFEIMDHYSYNFKHDSIYYVYDKETLVEYIIVISTSGYGNGCSITPRYNADGTLKIHDN